MKLDARWIRIEYTVSANKGSLSKLIVYEIVIAVNKRSRITGERLDNCGTFV